MNINGFSMLSFSSIGFARPTKSLEVTQDQQLVLKTEVVIANCFPIISWFYGILFLYDSFSSFSSVVLSTKYVGQKYSFFRFSLPCHKEKQCLILAEKIFYITLSIFTLTQQENERIEKTFTCLFFCLFITKFQ